MNNQVLIQEITKIVLQEISSKDSVPASKTQERTDGRIFIPARLSNRHMHLDKQTLEALFGKGYELTNRNELTQPGQYACKETVTIVGPKMRAIPNVRILAPLRKETQIEISKTDGIALGIIPPVRPSGKLDGSSGITLVGPKGSVYLQSGLIRANRHIHLNDKDAAKWGIVDGQAVSVKISGEKPTTFEDCIVRIDPSFNTEIHLDTDDGNAADLICGTEVEIIK